MTGLAISIPTKKVSAWITETEPRNAEAWLASLPYADSSEASREIFQALYTLNRIELDPQERFKLLELYRGPVDVVTKGLQSHFAHGTYPLPPSRHQLANFVRQLYQEMAAGYKCCIWDQSKAFLSWGKKDFVTVVAERAITYLGEILMRSYRVYLPYPAGIWREINEIYRYTEELGRHQEPIATNSKDNDESQTVARRYLQVALLGLANPYQLPQDACLHIASFLGQWAGRARLLSDVEVHNPAGQFLIDLSTDGPPKPFPRDGAIRTGGTLRVLSAIELVRTVHAFVSRLQKGESARQMNLGFEQPDSASLELLQRMMRAWGLIARRRFSRIKRSSYVFLCVGVNAVHFFAAGQKPFESPEAPKRTGETDTGALPVNESETVEPAITSDAPLPTDDRTDEELSEQDGSSTQYVALDDEAPKPAHASPRRKFPTTPSRSVELYRIDRWQVRDISPRGMSLACYGGTGGHLRIGDLVGLQQINAMGRWNIAVVRWLKTPDPETLEIGVELLGADVRAGAARTRTAVGTSELPDFVPSLWVPPIESLHQPATLLIPRGVAQPPNDIELAIESEPIKRVRILKSGERSNSFEQVVFADVSQEGE